MWELRNVRDCATSVFQPAVSCRFVSACSVPALAFLCSIASRFRFYCNCDCVRASYPTGAAAMGCGASGPTDADRDVEALLKQTVRRATDADHTSTRREQPSMGTAGMDSATDSDDCVRRTAVCTKENGKKA